jgi:gamma-glutamylcyclotransferase (GGCT)/AIG2-like uncharacterized protein YtfP
MTLVFVYGTLRKGEHNAHVLGDSAYCGKSSTAPDYILLHLGGFPAIVPAPAGAGVSIVGEVYECDAQTMRDLDRLEGCPSFYYREQITLPDNGDQVWVYILNQDDRPACYPAIKSGDWRADNDHDWSPGNFFDDERI